MPSGRPSLIVGLALVLGLPAQGSAQDPPKRLTIAADFRLRHEEDRDRDSQENRFRNRLRGRLGATFRLTQDLTIGTRLTTGPRADPRSPYVNLGTGLEKLDVSPDRLYLSWQPADGRLRSLGIWSTVGKFPHPFERVLPYSELIWDADVQPEGVVAGIAPTSRSGSSSFTLALVGGYYLLDEQSNAADAAVTVLQGALRHNGTIGELTGTAGAYFYKDVGTSAKLLPLNQGNLVANGAFLSRFRIWTVGLWWQLPITVRGSGLAIATEYWKNERAIEENNDGIGVGATYGALRRSGDMAFYYQYQHVARESLFSPFAQDDFLLATNFRGHVAGGRYRLGTRADVHLWALLAAPDRLTPGVATADSDRLQKRVRLDIDIRF